MYFFVVYKFYFKKLLKQNIFSDLEHYYWLGTEIWN